MTQGRAALVAGATGLVGAELLRLLLEDAFYERVFVLARRPVPIAHPKLTLLLVDYDQLDELKPAIRVDDLYCCLGTTMKKAGSREAFRQVDYAYPLALARLGRRLGMQQYLVVTSTGADSRSRIFYSRVKGELEAALQEMNLPSLHVFRPSLLLGERSEHRLGEQIGAVIGRLIAPIMAGPLRAYRPIEACDVARAMLAAAQGESAGMHIYEGEGLCTARH